jgi:hypothetical protein
MIGAIMGGVQAAIGLGQTIAGIAKKKPIIPEAEIPQDVFRSLNDAEYQAMIGMPAEQRQRAIEDIQRGGATAFSRAKDLKSGVGLVSDIAQRETEGYRGLAEYDTERRYENINRLERRRDRMAEEERYAADVNRQLAIDERNRRDELIGAGLQNIVGGGATLGEMLFNQKEDGTGFFSPERLEKRAGRKEARAGRRDLRKQSQAMGSPAGATMYGNYETFA